MRSHLFPRTLALLAALPLTLAAADAPTPPPSGPFRPGPDHEERADVPHGVVTRLPAWESKIFPGTKREWAIYVPAQYKPDGTAAIMVFQDGIGYINPKGVWRIPTVFDNLIAKGEMPVTIAIFVNPGHDESRGGPQKKGASANNRGFEYNSLGDRYARFLLEEILPEVAKTYKFSTDPELHAIGGSSSGAIAAFTVAWERPDQFRKVFSTVGSFVNLAGGDAYPSLIRKTERKPIRVFQQDSSGDLDNPFGKWPIANQALHAALVYMGYDCRLEFAEGYGHNGNHGGTILPDAMRWLWRKEKPTPVINTKGDLAGDMSPHRLLIDGEGWQPVAEGIGSADAACTDAAGNFYYSDTKAPAIHKVALDGTKTKLSDQLASGLKFGPDGKLYACHGGAKKLFILDPATGAIEVLAADVTPNDLVVSKAGTIYFTETVAKQVVAFDLKTRTKRVVASDLANPNGLTLSPDEGTLAVSEHAGEFVWTFRVNADGALDAKSPYMSMRRPVDPKGDFKHNNPPPYTPAARGDGMTIDKQGRFYVTTALGVQVFDPTGRLCGVVEKPLAGKSVTSCVLSGAEHNYLYVTAGTAIYRRKVQATGL